MENKDKFAVIKGSHYNLGYLCQGKQINCKNKMCKKVCFFCLFIFRKLLANASWLQDMQSLTYK